jgi:hypothetical protein
MIRAFTLIIGMINAVASFDLLLIVQHQTFEASRGLFLF